MIYSNGLVIHVIRLFLRVFEGYVRHETWLQTMLFVMSLKRILGLCGAFMRFYPSHSVCVSRSWLLELAFGFVLRVCKNNVWWV